jgi:hypothetical protein
MQTILDSAFGDNENIANTDPQKLTVRYKCTLFFTSFKPTLQQKRTTLDGLVTEMQGRHYSYQQGSIEGSNLEAYFIHVTPHDLKEAIQDWKYCWFELPDNLKVFVADPRVEPVLGEETSDIPETNGAPAAYDSIDAKKKRALELLQAEGLGNYGAVLQIA